MKIAVYAIAKNEEQFVGRFCDSAEDADLILIADTGSTDGTLQALRHEQTKRSRNVEVQEICITPWRFDHARNAALALLPADVDVCVSLDLDEELQPGWREEIEAAWKLGETTRLRYGFDWGQGIAFQYEKIHARHGYRWHHPVHEYPVPDLRIVEQYAETFKLLVVHKPDNTKPRSQYLPLLRLAVAEDPHCPRNAFYFARELTFYSLWTEAIEALNKYLAMPQATWVNERCYAMRLLGQSFAELGDSYTAAQWYLRAAAEAPATREPWCELAMLAYRQSDWPSCLFYSLRCLRIDNKEKVYTMDPSVWGAKPWDLAALAAHNLGMAADALQYGKRAVELAPTDERLINNLKEYQKCVS